MQKENRMGVAPVPGLIVTMAVPIMISMVVQSMYNIVDSIFVARISEGALTNLILDPIMIFGYFGCPAMGVAGAAVATVIGQWVAALSGLLLHTLTNRELHIRLRGLRLCAKNIAAIYRVGAPTILTQAFGSIMIALMNLVLIAFSATAVAFFGVYFKLQNFLFMPLNGLGQGALPVVGFNLGAKKLARSEETYRTTIRFGLLLSALGAAVFMLLPGPLLSAFSASDAMKTMGIPALRIICISFLPASATMMIGYAISGMGNGMVNMLSTAIRQCVVLVPLAWLLGRIGGVGAMWYAFWVSEACALAFALWQLRRQMDRVRRSIKAGD